MSSAPADVRAKVSSVLQAGNALRRAPTAARVDWLVAAAGILEREASRSEGALAEETGLSPPMVAWGLRTTLRTVRDEALQDLASQAAERKAEPITMLAVVLAGNLFTAAVRAIMTPLLLGIPVVAKASSRETLFPYLMEDALREADPSLGAAVEVVDFPSVDLASEHALVERAGALAIYGSDDTLDAIHRRHRGVSCVDHGHGVSAAYCGPKSLRPDTIADTGRQLALDICAYDQRGCLSPQVVYATDGGDGAAQRLVDELTNVALPEMGRLLPRGPLPLEVGAQQAQWRGIAEIEGDLRVGADFAVALVAADQVRWSPAYRNVSIVPVAGLAEAFEAMRRIGRNLKCVGADRPELPSVRECLEASDDLQAYATPLGTMQTPAFDAPADGRPIWDGLLR